jgi:ABC-type Zn2+ transport system substrate-binding protein/surface adhesin
MPKCGFCDHNNRAGIDRCENTKHHNGNYRVNIWEQPKPVKNIVVTIAARIRSSYYWRYRTQARSSTANRR